MSLYCEPQIVLGQPEHPDGMIYRCIHCGQLYSRSHTVPPPRPCQSPRTGKMVVKLPLILQRFANFAVEYAKHTANGSPESTELEILESFKVCSSCQYYNDLAGLCNSCGCYLNLYQAQQNLNKLAWADAACPEGKWKSPLERRQEIASQTDDS